MIPPLIVDTALERGISLLAITDHNSSANIASVQKAALGTNLVVLPGMELQTREDVHSLCLFDTLEQIEQFQSIVNRTLPEITNRPEFFGEQFIVDESGEFIRSEERLLIVSSSLSINQAFEFVTNLGGLFIPAHINRKTFGLIESLGLIPEDIAFPALEISKHISQETAIKTIPGAVRFPLIQNGDAHRLDEILGRMFFHVENPTIHEIGLALQNSFGRNYKVVSN